MATKAEKKEMKALERKRIDFPFERYKSAIREYESPKIRKELYKIQQAYEKRTAKEKAERIAEGWRGRVKKVGKGMVKDLEEYGKRKAISRRIFKKEKPIVVHLSSKYENAKNMFFE